MLVWKILKNEWINERYGGFTLLLFTQQAWKMCFSYICFKIQLLQRLEHKGNIIQVGGYMIKAPDNPLSSYRDIFCFWSSDWILIGPLRERTRSEQFDSSRWGGNTEQCMFSIITSSLLRGATLWRATTVSLTKTCVSLSVSELPRKDKGPTVSVKKPESDWKNTQVWGCHKRAAASQWNLSPSLWQQPSARFSSLTEGQNQWFVCGWQQKKRAKYTVFWKSLVWGGLIEPDSQSRVKHWDSKCNQR